MSDIAPDVASEPASGMDAGAADIGAAPAAPPLKKPAAPPVKGAKGPAAGKAKTQDDTTGGPLMTVLVRNEFYRDGFRNMMWLAVIEAVVIAGLLVT
ncbi:MAG: hypothetical protein KGL10_01625, partial [Alphaproteobacteria bacterium]|nr:hypothetical protein [Alphaproteobacteria bacterium]